MFVKFSFTYRDGMVGATVLHQVLSETSGYPNRNHLKTQKIFGDYGFGVMQIKQWYSCFKDDRLSVENVQSSGRPSTRRNVTITEKVRIYHGGLSIPENC